MSSKRQQTAAKRERERLVKERRALKLARKHGTSALEADAAHSRIAPAPAEDAGSPDSRSESP